MISAIIGLCQLLINVLEYVEFELSARSLAVVIFLSRFKLS